MTVDCALEFFNFFCLAVFLFLCHIILAHYRNATTKLKKFKTKIISAVIVGINLDSQLVLSVCCYTLAFQEKSSVLLLPCEFMVDIVQELCESRGGRPGLSVLTSLLVSVDVKNY